MLQIAQTNTHGVSTRTSPLDNRQARADAIAANIRNTTESSGAVELLTRMRDGLQGRTGLVRLIHTTKTSGPNMAFQSFNKWIGQATRTLETKGALIAYFDQAGWDKTELNKYLGTITRPEDRIQGAEIFRILDAHLKQAPASGGAQPGNALLQPVVNNPPPQNAQQSRAEQNTQPIQPNQPAGGGGQPPRLSIDDLQGGNFSIVLPQAVEDSDGDEGLTMDEALEKSGIDRSNEKELGKGGFGKAAEVTRNGERIVLKLPLDPSRIDKFPKVTLDSIGQKPRLARTNEVTAAYLKAGEVPNVCIPTDFLVHTTRGGNSSYEVVPAGKEFKTWAVKELQGNPAPVIRIAGSLMPKAPGLGLEKLMPQTRRDLPALSRGDLRNIAKHSLETLTGFAGHGFVHGDIKPLNMLYESGTGKLTFIDTGGMAKISKDRSYRSATAFHAGRGVTPRYSHPNTLSKKVAHEQDLFSMGMSLLELGLRSSSNAANWNSAAGLVDRLNKSGNPADLIRAGLRGMAGNPGPDSVEDLALRLIEASLGEKKAILPARMAAILGELANHAAVGGAGLPPVNPDALKPPRIFSPSQASVEIRPPAKLEFEPDSLKNPADFLDGRPKGNGVSLKFGVNIDKAEDRFAEHLKQHAERELDRFATPGANTLGRAEREKEFADLAAAGPRKITFEGDNALELDFPAALDPGKAADLDARLQARNLPGIRNLASILPAFLSNKFMDGLLKDGSPERKGLGNFSFQGGPQTSQKIRILEDGTIRIEASRTRKADAVYQENGSSIGKKMALDPAKSSVTENVVLELRFRPTDPNKPPTAEITIKDVSYKLDMCGA